MSEHIFTDANFEAEVLKSDLPVLVDFFADWCGPCRMQGPIVEELAGELSGKTKVGKINIDQNGATAEKYGVMSIPTLIIFKGGEAKKTLVGLQGKEGLKSELEKLF
jgi:thioredoxin 1